MTRILYLFPHPDDESFGPAAAMAQQRRQGHRVELLTLTRGGATKKRHDLGLSVEEMGRVRMAEMERMAEALDLSELTVLDLPDSGLAQMDPRRIEAVVADHLRRARPEVVVTYPVHGISGFHDHLVTHAVVKRVYCQLVEEGAGPLRRLAFHTLRDLPPELPLHLNASKPEAIDVAVAAAEEDLEAQRRALACYESYQDVIERIDPATITGDVVYYELFGESYDPPLEALTDDLRGS
jgi:LmbE family N-acetylglucosaminyl deacetylase